MKTMRVKPVAGRACPMPERGGELLPDAGAAVPRDAYWQRRLDDGDAVLEGSAKASTKAAAVKTQPAKEAKA